MLTIKIVIRYILILFKQIGLLLKRKQKTNTFVFHHLPRCGGTSLRKSLGTCKNVYTDYRILWGKLYPPKYDLTKLGKDDCLAGHFELEGRHIFQRYPAIETDRRYKIFSFIRDPLDLCISLYYYQMKRGQPTEGNIRDFIFFLNKTIWLKY